MEEWSARFRAILDEIARVHAPRDPIDLDDVADMLSCVIDGGIIMSKALNDLRRLERQVLAFRSFVKLLFSPASPRPESAAAEPAYALHHAGTHMAHLG